MFLSVLFIIQLLAARYKGGCALRAPPPDIRQHDRARLPHRRAGAAPPLQPVPVGGAVAAAVGGHHVAALEVAVRPADRKSVV